MKKNFRYWGMVAAATVVLSSTPQVAFAQENTVKEEKTEFYTSSQNVSPYESVNPYEKEKTNIYAAEIQYGLGTVTVGAAVTSKNSENLEVELILQDSSNILSKKIPEDMEPGTKEGRYPLIRVIDGEIFLNGNNLLNCLHMVSGKKVFTKWKENFLPEKEWIYVDAEFLSMIERCLERMPDVQKIEQTLEKWAEPLWIEEKDGDDKAIALNETILVTLAEKLDNLGREYRNSVESLINEDLIERFDDDYRAAVGDIEEAFPENTIVYRGLQSLFQSWDWKINQYLGANTVQNAIYNADLASWLLWNIEDMTLDGSLEIQNEHAKLVLTGDDQKYVLEAGGSEELAWGRMVGYENLSLGEEGELWASFVLDNGEKEKEILCKIGNDRIKARLTTIKSNLFSILLQSSRRGTKFSGTVAVNEDDSVVISLDRSMYSPIESIRLYAVEKQESGEGEALEAPQPQLNLDTLVYQVAYENMKQDENKEE